VLVVTAARFGSGAAAAVTVGPGAARPSTTGALAGLGYLLGPLAVGITSATGIVTAGVRHWSKRRASAALR
jgi:hypothetical protein